MENLLKNKLNLFYLGTAITLVVIVMVIAAIVFFPRSSTTNTSNTTSLISPSPTIRISPPQLQSTIMPTKQGVFTVTFAKAPDPNVFTITLSSSAKTPGSQTVSIPFISAFQDNGKLLVITTKNALQANTIYYLYVRLISNNHIVVKHRYENINGKLTIIDTD